MNNESSVQDIAEFVNIKKTPVVGVLLYSPNLMVAWPEEHTFRGSELSLLWLSVPFHDADPEKDAEVPQEPPVVLDGVQSSTERLGADGGGVLGELVDEGADHRDRLLNECLVGSFVDRHVKMTDQLHSNAELKVVIEVEIEAADSWRQPSQLIRRDAVFVEQILERANQLDPTESLHDSLSK